MSDLASGYYGDYGMAEATARKRRNMESVANRQAATLGQMRGTRKLSELTRGLTEGFRPKMASYGQRGLAGPNVASGIQRAGLERYAADLQKGIGGAEISLQEELNRIALDEANSQNELEQYIADQNRQKQNEILQAALTLQDLGSY